MKRLLSVTAFVIAAGALAAGSAFAGARDEESISRFCSDRNDFGLSHGACVAQFTTRNTTPHNADVCKLAWVRAFVKAKNEGECVTALNALSR